jgi:hypothetical protein
MRLPTLSRMQSSGRDLDQAPTEASWFTEEDPALRDAATIAALAAADEAAAHAARERYRDELPMPSIEADDGVATHLQSDERVLGLRRHAILRSPGGDAALGYGGTLYLTSRRLIHLGQVNVSVQLVDIVETSLSGERLLLSLQNGEGMALDLDGPRLLRAEMAAAARRART